MSEIWLWGPMPHFSFLLLGNQNKSIVRNFNKLIQCGEQKRRKKGTYVLVLVTGPVVNLSFLTLWLGMLKQ